METIIYKCPGCGANLKYDIETKLMFCDCCGQFYPPEDVKQKAEENAEAENRDWHMEGRNPHHKEHEEYIPDYMEVNIFHCSSCGAEIMTNDVEVSKFCAYCGQSTIIFDRISREQRPDLILPFKISKADALSNVKKRFSKAMFMPDDWENISVNSVYAIYMPYWIYDSHMEMGVKGKIEKNKSSIKFDEAGEMDMRVTLDASRRFNDTVSLLLNPFPSEELEKFDTAYLSGFFGDRFDVPYDRRKKDAVNVISDRLEEALIENVNGMPSKKMRDTYDGIYKTFGTIKINRYDEKYTLQGIFYAFMPVYFITFRIKNQLINILVNGATGRVVGSVPIDEEKLKKAQKREMTIYGVILGVTGALIFRYISFIWGFVVLASITGFIAFAGKKAADKFEMLRIQTNSESMFDISRCRK